MVHGCYTSLSKLTVNKFYAVTLQQYSSALDTKTVNKNCRRCVFEEGNARGVTKLSEQKKKLPMRMCES